MTNMTKAVLALLILVTLYFSATEIATVISHTNSAIPIPDLVVTPAELVFDRVPFRGSAEQQLRFTNVSTYPIRLNEAHWSCGCMQMKFQSRELQPGQSCEYTVVMQGTSASAAKSGGELLVLTSSSTNAKIRIKVRATEIYGILTVPETVDFGRPEYEKLPITVPLRILVNGLSEAEANSIRIQSRHPAVKCGALRRNTDGDVQVDVQLIGNEVVGNVLSTLTISGDGFDTLSVSAFAAIRHSLHAQPPSLLMQKTLESADLAVRDHNGNPIPIERAIVSASLETLLRCVSSHEKHVRVEWIDPQNASGHVVRGEIELLAKDQSGRMIAVSVPVTAFGGGH